MESDAAVVKRVLNGEVEAFSILVERYFDHYVRFAIHLVGNREDAEEVVQAPSCAPTARSGATRSASASARGSSEYS